MAKKTKTTNQILKDELAISSRALNANPNLIKLSKTDLARGHSIIPAVALADYNKNIAKGEPSKVKKSLDVRSGQYDWTKGGTGVDLLHQNKELVTTPEGILQFSPLHWWDTDNVSVDGSTTTVSDIGTIGGLNIENPTSGVQPTLNSADSNFNGYDSLTFDSSKYLSNGVSNFRGADSTGLIVSVIRLRGGTLFQEFSSADSSAGSPYINSSLVSSNTYRIIHNAGSLVSFRGSTDVVTGSPTFVIAHACTGSSYKLWVDGSEETISMIAGANDGSVWFDSSSSEDSISIGARLTSSISYGNIDWVASGYFAYTDDATAIDISNFLVSKYNP